MTRNNLLLLLAIGVAVWWFGFRDSAAPPTPDHPSGELVSIAADALNGRESDGWFYAALYGRLAELAESGEFEDLGELVETTDRALEISGIDRMGPEFGEAAFSSLGGPGPVTDETVSALNRASHACLEVADEY